MVVMMMPLQTGSAPTDRAVSSHTDENAHRGNGRVSGQVKQSKPEKAMQLNGSNEALTFSLLLMYRVFCMHYIYYRHKQIF
jgi:hypothetical protein